MTFELSEVSLTGELIMLMVGSDMQTVVVKLLAKRILVEPGLRFNSSQNCSLRRLRTRRLIVSVGGQFFE